jgi:formate dehydrogenase subunit gamma
MITGGMDKAVGKKQHPGWLREMEHEGKLIAWG